MASWGAVVLLAGFEADAAAGRLAFRPTVARRRRLAIVLVRARRRTARSSCVTGVITLDVLGGAMTCCRLGPCRLGGRPRRQSGWTGSSIAFEVDRGRLVFEPVATSWPARGIEVDGPGSRSTALSTSATFDERGGDAMEPVAATT